jgi:hypothetical protein
MTEIEKGRNFRPGVRLAGYLIHPSFGSVGPTENVNRTDNLTRTIDLTNNFTILMHRDASVTVFAGYPAGWITG